MVKEVYSILNNLMWAPGHGQCRDGSCKCDEGYAGPDCQLDIQEKSTCPTGILDAQGECCESGLFNHLSGECCPGKTAVLDRDGICCSGQLDMCGRCNGTAIFVDALGRCCDVSQQASQCLCD